MIKYLTKLPLLKRLLPSIIRRICNLLNINFFVVRYEKIYLKLKIADAVDRHILFRGEYENAQIEYLLESIKKNQIDYFIDIGSNIGLYSLLVEKNFPKIKIFSFEPHPENFKKLRNNILNNKIKNIEYLNYALGIDNEDRFMIEGSIPGGHKVSNNNSTTVDIGGGIRVQAVKLESIMDKLKVDKINFLKLDCEGAEGEIIKSLGVTGLKKIDKIAVEFHNNHSILNHSEIENILNASGFTTTISWNGESYFGYIYGIR